MKKWSRILRAVAYLSGMAGAACVVAGRRHGNESSMVVVGIGLLGVMFVTFFATFMLQAWQMMTRHSRRDAEG